MKIGVIGPHCGPQPPFGPQKKIPILVPPYRLCLIPPIQPNNSFPSNWPPSLINMIRFLFVLMPSKAADSATNSDHRLTVAVRSDEGKTVKLAQCLSQNPNSYVRTLNGLFPFKIRYFTFFYLVHRHHDKPASPIYPLLDFF